MNPNRTLVFGEKKKKIGCFRGNEKGLLQAQDNEVQVFRIAHVGGPDHWASQPQSLAPTGHNKHPTTFDTRCE
jgi:hypothetical protein